MAAAPIRLVDYTPYPFEVPSIALDVCVQENHVQVISCMEVEPSTPSSKEMILQGIDLILEGISINNVSLQLGDYQLFEGQLVIKRIPKQPFSLRISCRIDPFSNTSLEGLYASSGMLTTQCEAEGFRRICFHPDRPDVLSRYRVRIEASLENYPVLLSNGNLIESGPIAGNPNRHSVTWEDPSLKPSYLFALVAGDLREIRDSFQTRSGRIVQLRLHVEEGDQPYTSHAMKSLKRAMEWDEKVYGLEYDLNEYNIVAVRHFNMGAMENKSLNIFNSKLVLADAETATDSELERIESVIAHEYFHNWTGNRITCRDWFQLSLKEGLTVFRDQSFTADLHSEGVKRIEDVSMLRNTQFREDAGPTAHPVKPSEYYAIDNFYTTTIYEKGAELIRMLHTLLGHQRFMQGMATYVRRFDGTAATTEDFVQAIVDGAEADGHPLRFNPDQFRRWYHQAGTPQVSIKRYWDEDAGLLRLKLSQMTPSTQGQTEKLPVVIPVALALIGPNGRLGNEQLMVLDQSTQELILKAEPAPAPPALSLFRDFSAPVHWSMEVSIDETLQLFAVDDDPVARWEAGQSLWRQVLLARASGEINHTLEARLLTALETVLSSAEQVSAREIAALLSMPGRAELESLQEPADPLAIHHAVVGLRAELGLQLAKPLHVLLEHARESWEAEWPKGQGERELTGMAWSWLIAAGELPVRQEALNAVQGPSMTLARSALRALQTLDCPERLAASEAFYERWQQRPVILDAWFAYEASTPSAEGLLRVSQLLNHPRFDPLAPNSLRAVLGGLAANTPVFHAEDGSGYLFMANQILDVDQRNAITASRMVKVFSRWRSFGHDRQALMLAAIEELAAAQLSSNTREIVDQILL